MAKDIRRRSAAHKKASRKRDPNKGAPRTSSAGREFQRLVDVMRRLRGPGGCPWDREQTIQTLRPFVLEETYEVLDAIDREDHDALRGEIGDLLFEGVFLAQLEADEGRFTVSDSLREVTAKLVRRHPHVFGAAKGRHHSRAKCSSNGSRSSRANRSRPAPASRSSAECRKPCPPCWARTRSAPASRRSASSGRRRVTSSPRSRKRSPN